MSLPVQFFTLLLMTACGLGLGAVFDTYRVLAGQWRLPRSLTPVLDVMYWLAATCAVFWLLYYSNYGQVRFFIFPALVCGGWLYFRLFSRLMIRAVQWVILLVKYIFWFIYRSIYLLIIAPILVLYRLCKIVIAFLAAVIIFLMSPFRRLLVWLWRTAAARVKLPEALRRKFAAIGTWLKKNF